MTQDDFFTKENCDRCSGDLTVRTLSWFNQDVICGTCSVWEEAIINEQQKSKNELESIGYIPDVKFEIQWGYDVPDKLHPTR